MTALHRLLARFARSGRCGARCDLSLGRHSGPCRQAKGHVDGYHRDRLGTTWKLG